MESYISQNMFRKKIEVRCSITNNTYSGTVELVKNGILMLADNGLSTYVSIDKIESLKELE